MDLEKVARGVGPRAVVKLDLFSFERSPPFAANPSVAVNFRQSTHFCNCCGFVAGRHFVMKTVFFIPRRKLEADSNDVVFHLIDLLDGCLLTEDIQPCRSLAGNLIFILFLSCLQVTQAQRFTEHKKSANELNHWRFSHFHHQLVSSGSPSGSNVSPQSTHLAVSVPVGITTPPQLGHSDSSSSRGSESPGNPVQIICFVWLMLLILFSRRFSILPMPTVGAGSQSALQPGQRENPQNVLAQVLPTHRSFFQSH